MILCVLRSSPFESVVVLLLGRRTILASMAYTERVGKRIELLVTPIEHRRFPERFPGEFVPEIGAPLPF